MKSICNLTIPFVFLILSLRLLIVAFLLYYRHKIVLWQINIFHNSKLFLLLRYFLYKDTELAQETNYMNLSSQFLNNPNFDYLKYWKTWILWDVAIRIVKYIISGLKFERYFPNPPFKNTSSAITNSNSP